MSVSLAIRRRFERHLPAKTVNLWCHITEGAFASFGMELVGAGVIFSVLAGALGATPAFLGMLTSFSRLAFIVPIIFAPRVEAYPKKKRLVMLLGIGQRLPLILIAACLLLFAKDAPLMCLLAIAVVNLMGNIVVSVLVGPWMDLIAETIQTKLISRLFGFRNGISSILGLGSGAASAAIIALIAFPGNYATLYLVGFASMAVSWLIFGLVDEIPADAPPREKKPARAYYRDLIRVMKGDRTYRWYLAYGILSKIGMMTAPFYAFIAVKVYNVPEALAAGTFITARYVARVIGNWGFPFLSERIGHRKVLSMGVLLYVASTLVAAFAPSGMWYIAVFFISGLAMACQSVSGSAFNVQVIPPGRRIGYQSLAGLLTSPIGMALPILAGLAIQGIGHMYLFAGSALIILCGLYPLSKVKPRYNKE